MSSASERRTYCPIGVLRDDQGKQYLALDYNAAAYEGLGEQNIGFDLFQITDETAGQPDAVAWKFYKDSTLWWVICLFNDIVDPYTEFTSGTKLRVPRLDEVMLYLSRNQITSRLLGKGRQVGSIGEL